MSKKVIEREIYSSIKKSLFRPKITLLLGARQTGKTTLLYELQKYLNSQGTNEILFYNLDRFDDELFFKDQSELINLIKRKTKGKRKVYLFVDEAQRVKNAGRFFKGIYDTNLPLKMVLTGSSSLEIKSKIYEPLTGRKEVFVLTGFSFKEFVSARLTNLLSLLPLTLQELTAPEFTLLKNAYTTYLITGGYPASVLADDTQTEQRELQEILSSYLERDIAGYLGFKDRAAFAYLMRLLAAQTGSLVNENELQQALGISRETVERYINALESTFVTATARPYHNNMRKVIRKMPKIYFLDNGILNTLLKSWNQWNERIDKGKLLKTSIAQTLFRMLKPTESLFFFRTTYGTECDFVFFKDTGPVLIETKVSLPSTQDINSLTTIAKKINVEKIICTTLKKPETIIRKGEIPLEYKAPWQLTDL